MVKKLRQIGNSVGILIDRPILELLGLRPGDELEITTDGKALLLTPVSEDHDDKVVRSAKRMSAIHSKTFKRLAE